VQGAGHSFHKQAGSRLKREEGYRLGLSVKVPLGVLF